MIESAIEETLEYSSKEFDEFSHFHLEVYGDNLAQQAARNVSPFMNRDGGSPTVRMSEPMMRTAGSGFSESQLSERPDQLSGRDGGNGTHVMIWRSRTPTKAPC